MTCYPTAISTADCRSVPSRAHLVGQVSGHLPLARTKAAADAYRSVLDRVDADFRCDVQELIEMLDFEHEMAVGDAEHRLAHAGHPLRQPHLTDLTDGRPPDPAGGREKLRRPRSAPVRVRAMSTARAEDDSASRRYAFDGVPRCSGAASTVDCKTGFGAAAAVAVPAFVGAGART
ncbi:MULTISPECIES: hypothetical protein [unclassified Streptomyces]|uniref:DUF7691 family protein n=1 Tax=unclassified Streptomyces TaxID=2593676 RepID=UPI003825EEA6